MITQADIEHLPDLLDGLQDYTTNEREQEILAAAAAEIRRLREQWKNYECNRGPR